MTVDQVKLQHSPKSGFETRDRGTGTPGPKNREPRPRHPDPKTRDPDTRDPGNETPGPRDQQLTPITDRINPIREANLDNKKLGCVC